MAGGRGVRCVIGVTQQGNRSGWLTTNWQGQNCVKPGFSAATTRRANREKRLGWCGKHRFRRFLPRCHPQHGRPEPRVVWGFQARKRARRLSEPFNMVVGWNPAPNLSNSAPYNRCELLRKGAESSPNCNNPTSSARPGSPAKCIRQDASSIPFAELNPRPSLKFCFLRIVGKGIVDSHC